MRDSFDDQLWQLQQRFQTRAIVDATTLAELSVRLEQGSSSRAQIQQISHSLAGAGGTFGFADVSSRAVELGNLIVGSASHFDVAQGCRALIAEIKRISGSVGQRTAFSGATARRPSTSTFAVGAATRTESPGAEVEVTAENLVGVVAAADGFAPLAAAIASLGFKPVDISLSSAAEHSVVTGTAVAVVISDAVDGWMKITRQMSMQIPVLLITNDMSFHPRLAAARVGVSGVLARPLAGC